MRSVVGLMLASCAASSGARAQQSATVAPIVNTEVVGTTAASCKKDASRWYDAAYKAASDSADRKLIKAIDFGDLSRQQSQQLRQCALTLDANAVDGEALLELARVYAKSGEPERALSATKRYLSATPSDSMRAVALQSMMAQYRGTNLVLLQRAEPYAELIDALPQSVNLQKIAAHEALFRSYQYLEVDLAVQAHTRAIITFAKRVHAHVKTAEAPGGPAGKIDASMLLSVYMYAAMIEGNFGHEDAGIALLQQARLDHPEIEPKHFDAMHNPIVDRLRLIGQPARSVTSEHWFNTPDSTRTMGVGGDVTLIGFTAHWCPPCQATYGPLQALSDSLSSRGLRVFFATEFYGYVGSKRGLTEAQEVDATRQYYAGKHISFPIAMLGAAPNAGDTAPREPSPEYAFYQIQQVPQTVIIDRRGKVRRIIMGWDPANSERLPALLGTLLLEK